MTIKQLLVLSLALVCCNGCSIIRQHIPTTSWQVITNVHATTGDKKTVLTNSGEIHFTCFTSRKSIYLSFGGDVESVPSNAVNVTVRIDGGDVIEYSGYTGRDSYDSGFAELFVVNARTLLNELSGGKKLLVKVDTGSQINSLTEDIENIDEHVVEFMKICL